MLFLCCWDVYETFVATEATTHFVYGGYSVLLMRWGLTSFVAVLLIADAVCLFRYSRQIKAG